MVKKKLSIQKTMIGVGAFMVFLSYLIFKFIDMAFLRSIQAEFASAGIVLLLVGGIWLITGRRLST